MNPLGEVTDSQFREFDDGVMKTSANYFNMANPIRQDSALEVLS